MGMFKTDTFTANVYLRSGQIIVLRDLVKFGVSRNESGTMVEKITWTFAPGVKQQVLALLPNEIMAVITEQT
jgi:hypothetical protein